MARNGKKIIEIIFKMTSYSDCVAVWSNSSVLLGTQT